MRRLWVQTLLPGPSQTNNTILILRLILGINNVWQELDLLNVTEWDIGSWCQLHYIVTISVHCHKSTPVMMFVFGVVLRPNIYGHIRTHGNFIVLPHWDSRPLAS